MTSMDYEQICKDILDLDKTIRFAMIVEDGKRKFGGYRYDVIGILDSEELEQSIWYAYQRMVGRFMTEHKLGKTRYAMAEYEKVKRVTVPLNAKTLLLVSMDPNSKHDKIIQNILKLI